MKDYNFNGKSLLAGVLGWGEAHLDKAIKVRDVYKVYRKPKKGGGFRILAVPHLKLMEFQRRFLRYFLYRILLQGGWIGPQIHGFVPKRSHVSNAQYHANITTKHLIRLDIKDAFPSITSDMIRETLWKVLSVEVLRYRLIGMSDKKGIRREYPRPPLFSSKRKVKWFRRLFNQGPRPRWLNKNVNPYDVLQEFVDVLIPLVTLGFNGCLPQGAPTSPFLLNLVLSHYEIPEKIYEWFSKRGFVVKISVYADDFTISSSTQFSGETISELMNFIEQERLFLFNRKKTAIFDYKKTAPLVTGLRIVNLPPSSMYALGKVKIGLPKKKLRKIRGIIHRAITTPKLHAKAEGYVAYLKGIYGSELPKQITAPYRKYCLATGKEI